MLAKQAAVSALEAEEQVKKRIRHQRKEAAQVTPATDAKKAQVDLMEFQEGRAACFRVPAPGEVVCWE